MKKETFKKIILLQIVLLPIFVIKFIMFPYYFAPEAFRQAMLAYDELQPLPDNFILFLFLIYILAYFISLFMLYRFNHYGRSIFLWTTISSFLLVFSSSYYTYDSLDYFFEFSGTLLAGFTIAISYFSSLSKVFKK